MSRLVLRATDYAHLFLKRIVREGDTVLDATAGNGRDSCFLAALVGKQGRVWAFDVQEAACAQTRALAQAHGVDTRLTVVCDSHANLASYGLPPLAAVVFNLGWLPGGDHRLVTRQESTIPALQSALALLKPGGLLVVTVYPGHDDGVEQAAVLAWLRQLPTGLVQTLQLCFPQKEQAPSVLLMEKQGE